MSHKYDFEATIKGIEAYYGDMPHKLYTEPLLALTKNHNLIITGGSDYHGANRPGIKLGCAKVPGEVLEVISNSHIDIVRTKCDNMS